jgi:hypothetical protein
MKTIIAGSRSIVNFAFVTNAVKESGFEVTEVISGTAWGVDKLGEKWAYMNNVPVKQFPAQWKEHGKAAGFIRNEEMAEYADALIAVWDGSSAGTKNMIDKAKEKLLKIYVKFV